MTGCWRKLICGTTTKLIRSGWELNGAQCESTAAARSLGFLSIFTGSGSELCWQQHAVSEKHSPLPAVSDGWQKRAYTTKTCVAVLWVCVSGTTTDNQSSLQFLSQICLLRATYDMSCLTQTCCPHSAVNKCFDIVSDGAVCVVCTVLTAWFSALL